MRLCASEGRRAWGLCIDRLVRHLSLAPPKGAPILASSSPNWAEITACIAFAALIGAFIQLWGARRSNRRTNAFAYYGRYSDPDALPYLAEMTKLLKKSTPPETDDARWRKWNEQVLETRLKSLVFVNFWEELGGLYNRRLVDRTVIRIYLGAVLVALWERGQWFVERSKEEDGRALEQWGRMAADIKKWLYRRDHPRWYRRAWKAVVRLTKRGQ